MSCPAKKAGLFSVFIVILKRLPDLLVSMLSTGERSTAEFSLFIKLVSVEYPDVKQNCFTELGFKVVQMMTKAQEIGGTRGPKKDDERSVVVIKKPDAGKELVNYLASCRRLCEEYSGWVFVFWLGKKLVSFHEADDSQLPPDLSPVALECLKETGSALPDLLDQTLALVDFTTGEKGQVFCVTVTSSDA